MSKFPEEFKRCKSIRLLLAVPSCDSNILKEALEAVIVQYDILCDDIQRVCDLKTLILRRLQELSQDSLSSLEEKEINHILRLKREAFRDQIVVVDCPSEFKTLYQLVKQAHKLTSHEEDIADIPMLSQVLTKLNQLPSSSQVLSQTEVDTLLLSVDPNYKPKPSKD